jgi:hypothetical protein
MSIGLQVTYLYHDLDMVEVSIAADNGRFRATADVYVGRGELQQAADTLRGFPATSQDTREVTFGSFGPGTAGGAVRLEFFCKDLAGHTAFRAIMEEDYPERESAQCATLLVDFEPAALDKFLRELTQVEAEFSSATLTLQVI